MDCEKIGQLIRNIRREKGYTQKQLADIIGVGDKAVSKWERGCGLPDVTLWQSLSEVLSVNIEDILSGAVPQNNFVNGNMKNIQYYICPRCNNITVSAGEAAIYCCGRRLESIQPQKADESTKLTVEESDGDWYITGSHPMEKDNYISFVAFVTGDSVQLYKQYPQWTMQVRLPKCKHGTLMYYSTTKGLFYQYL